MKYKLVSTASRIWSAVNEPAPPHRRGRVRGSWRIGDVVASLREHFPDVTASKVRYLESRGLITPTRTAGGTRFYSREDRNALAQILSWQRDEFLPLDVIAQRLVDAAIADAVTPAGDRDAAVTALPPAPTAAMTAQELALASGVPEDVVHECAELGFIRRWDASALPVCRAIGALVDQGWQPRHLRSVRLSVDRELDFIDTLTPAKPPTGTRANSSTDDQAAQRRVIAAAVLRLHTALLHHQL